MRTDASGRWAVPRVGGNALAPRTDVLRSAKELDGYTIAARDGEIGRVETIYFDDATWTVRYFVVDTSNWLPGRRVLISPLSIEAVDEANMHLRVRLTREQVQNSPDIDTAKPISRQHELEYYRYYGFPYYWGGPEELGMAPIPLTTAAAEVTDAPAERAGDPHLRSTGEVFGYAIHATDGELGHVDDVLVDDETWAVRYLIIDTGSWWPGKKIAIAPEWIERVSWSDAAVYVTVPGTTIKKGPEYDPSQPFDRAREERLYDAYDRRRYWDRGDAA
jgi:sporulation protein YlmC with PRC-barrel domain